MNNNSDIFKFQLRNLDSIISELEEAQRLSRDILARNKNSAYISIKDVIDYGNRVAYSTYAPLPSDIPENLVFEAGYIQPTPNTLQMQKSQLYKERLDEVKQYLSAQMSGQTLIDETPIQTNITGEQKLPIVDSQPQLLANKFSNPAMIAGISPTFINQMNRMKQLFKIGNAIEKDDDDESSEENETETKKDKLN